MTTQTEDIPEVPTQGTAPEPVPGSPEYDAAMAAKYQKANGIEAEGSAAEGGDEKPELILGKFKDVNALAEAYKELERKLGQPKEQPKEDKLTIGDDAAKEPAKVEPKDESKGESKDEPKDDEKVEPAAALQATFDKAAAEFDETGDIGPETRAALVKQGIPEQFIDTYLEGVRAQVAAIQNEIYSLVGGKENFEAMREWAKTLPEEEIAAFDEAVVNPKTTALAVQGLYARYVAANGSEQPSITASADHASLGGDVYKSRAEMTSDMRDPRYQTDEAFRREVHEKIARSRTAGTLGPMGVAY